MRIKTWYLLATPDKRKKYKVKILSQPIFSHKNIMTNIKILQQNNPYKKIWVLKRTCQIFGKY